MIYDALLLLAFPKIVWDRWKRGRVRPTFAERLGRFIPDTQGKPVIWIHAVSVGEIKSAEPLYQKLKGHYPTSFFLITTTTATGQDEARRTLSTADAFGFLPLDFSWITRRWVKALKPTHFILIESDFWYNLLSTLKQNGTLIILASGKMSPRSAKRFLFFPYFAKKLFSLFDLLCVQNSEHAARFAPFAQPIVTGNLKLDISPKPVTPPPWKTELYPVTISCTHDPEEEQLLLALKPLLPRLQIFLAPRHPERFSAVEKLLDKLNIPSIRWSQIERKTGQENVILIDSMGQLPICYALSHLAIVAGSFTDKVGGHNLLEPLFYGTPSLFGPHTWTQNEFAKKIIEAQAGLQLPLSQLASILEQLMENPDQLTAMKQAGSVLIESSRGAAERTFSQLKEKEFGDKSLSVL